MKQSPSYSSLVQLSRASLPVALQSTESVFALLFSGATVGSTPVLLLPFSERLPFSFAMPIAGELPPCGLAPWGLAAPLCAFCSLFPSVPPFTSRRHFATSSPACCATSLSRCAFSLLTVMPIFVARRMSSDAFTPFRRSESRRKSTLGGSEVLLAFVRSRPVRSMALASIVL